MGENQNRRRYVAIEERLLGVKAVEKRFISEKHLIKGLNHIEFVDPSKKLEEFFLENGYLTQTQLTRLKEELNKETKILDSRSFEAEKVVVTERTFGNIATRQNMINQMQLDEVVEEQKIYHDRGLRVQIGQILYKKQYLTVAQVKRVLQAQSKTTLFCKKCNNKKVVCDYKPGTLVQCDAQTPQGVCGFDMVVLQVKLKGNAKPAKQKEPEDIGELIELTLD